MNNTQKFIDWITATVRETVWAPLGVLLFYGTGLLFGLYDRYPPLDMPTHFLGGMAITYFYRSAIRHAQRYIGEIPLPIQTLLAFTTTGTTAILWEFLENLSDYFLSTNHVHGLRDTLTDLFMGLFGALLFTLFYRKRYPENRN